VGRVHLFELEDFAWYPSSLRDMETDLLQFMIHVLRAYDLAAPDLAELLRSTGEDRIVDLCSGGSGPWIGLRPQVAAELGRAAAVTLTDTFPNQPALERARLLAGVAFVPESVDATAVPAELGGVRTLFSSFHHFPPDLARAILHDAYTRRCAIAVYEITARTPLEILRYVVALPFLFLVTPFVRPFRLSRLVFTYLLPIVPLVALWDGVVSCLRTYSPAELEDLVAGLHEGYRWEARRVRRWWRPTVTSLVGTPT
jgi:hypothetical protein